MIRPRTTLMLTAVVTAGTGLALVAAQSARPQPAPPPRAAARPASLPMMTSVNPALFRGMKYRLVGPSRGGRVTTVTGVPSQPRTFYMGVASGGVFRTTDGGANWAADHRRQGPAGIDRVDRRRRLRSQNHLSRHRFGRRAQQRLDGTRRLQDDRRRRDVAVHRSLRRRADRRRPHPSHQPRHRVGVGDGRRLQGQPASAACSRPPTAARPGRRCSTSTTSVGAMDVEVQPGNPNVVYAWMSHLERKPWTIISGGKDGGFYKSTDGGEHFTKIATGLPGDVIGKANLAVTAAKPDRVYALVEAKPGGGLYRSDDAGQTWTPMNPPAPPRHDPAAVLLHDARRGSDQRRRRLRRRGELLQVDRRRQDVRVDAHAARRQPRHLDQPEGRQHA